MARRKTPEEWRAEVERVIVEMCAFNAKHPHATWDETEDAVDQALAGLRRELMADSVQGHALADVRWKDERPRCPVCGGPVRAVGQRRRTVTTRGEAAVEIERTQARCVACGATFFPPG